MERTGGIKFVLLLAIILIAVSGCATHRAAPGVTNITGPKDYYRALVHDGINRTYTVHVPPGYVPGKPVPMVLNFHGGGGDAYAAITSTRMNELADREGFIVVYPEGTGTVIMGRLFGTWNAGRCCQPATMKNIDDVGFVSDVIDRMEQDFTIDPGRIYATGASNGAQMTYRLACEMPDRIAAIGPVMSVGSMDVCNPDRPVPVIQFKGTADPCTPYWGGQACGGCFSNFFKRIGVPLPESTYECYPTTVYMEKWRDLNSCSNETIVIYRNGSATCTAYTGCRNGSEVVLCTVEGMGHTWPGGTYGGACERWGFDSPVCRAYRESTGELSSDINANEVMWDFFKRHSL